MLREGNVCSVLIEGPEFVEAMEPYMLAVEAQEIPVSDDLLPSQEEIISEGGDAAGIKNDFNPFPMRSNSKKMYFIIALRSRHFHQNLEAVRICKDYDEFDSFIKKKIASKATIWCSAAILQSHDAGPPELHPHLLDPWFNGNRFLSVRRLLCVGQSACV